MSRQEVEQAQEEMAQMYSKEQLVSEAKKTSRRSKRSTHCERFLPTNIEVCGAILQKYKEVGGPVSQYLWPVEPMAQNPDGQGFRQRFQNGFIYWHPQAGAHTVSTYTAEYWKRQGWEAGWMGYPTTDEFGVRDGQGAKQVFQHADVYRSPLWTIASVKGRIRDRCNELGGVEGELGYPLTGELATPDGRGWYNTFMDGGIYWTPEHDAHEVLGAMYMYWGVKGVEAGELGYPVSSPADSFGPVQEFERGRVDLYQKFADAPTQVCDGKEYNGLVLEITDAMGNLSNLGWRYPKNGRDDKDTRVLDYGGVLIPDRYKTLIDNKSTVSKSLRDYCTKSPDDGVESLGENISFKGICARHDICYYDSGSEKQGWVSKRKCDHDLFNNLYDQCTNVSMSISHQRLCHGNDRVYYSAVVATHRWDQYVQCGDVYTVDQSYCGRPKRY
ncbi:phospholipase A2 [Corynebacterium sp. CCM 9203]|uniref:phospholipase A2 n=1 Tax=Corynebacterium sp. CCM 9203 TaxID=3057615 RepID=UPI003526B5F9